METKQKLGQGQYFPQLEQSGDPEIWNSYNGVTIRQKIGSNVLCALLSNTELKPGLKYTEVVKEALDITDEFLRQEAE